MFRASSAPSFYSKIEFEVKADRLAHSVRKQPSFVVHMDADHPAWFTESV